MGIAASKRLRANSDFQKVRRLGRRVPCGPFIMNLQMDDGSTLPARLGVIASRRVGNAVKRNRGKRLVRELFRRHGADFPIGTNWVVVLRSGFDRYDFGALERQFCRAAQQLIGHAGPTTRQHS
ncbi:MAG: ribonuclease P protein component [Opitutales bacterium]